MIYEPGEQFTDFHQSREILRMITGRRGSGKTTAGINEVGYLLPKWIKDNYGVTETRWAVVSFYRHDLPIFFMNWFPQAQFSHTSGKMIIDHEEGISVEIFFFSGSADSYRWYKMPKDEQGKRHKVEHVRFEYSKLKAFEMTGYFIESADHLPELRRELNGRIGRYPRKCPVRFGIEEES